ncbi:MAG: methylglyoxal synthase [Hyphomicrobiales bacterium]|nr:methylglyoxal synthase [Hyphomicrobiales bacterium]MDE2017921.1 methylglyoxal synthase [Hyphomicrobiales bacterium]
METPGLGRLEIRLTDDPRRCVLAIVAHDRKKDAMAEWAARHRGRLAGFDLVATGTTGARVIERCPELAVTRLKSGPLGGDQQIGAMIAEGAVNALVFFVDPLSPHPHDVDVKALTRLACVYDIPMALNPATAELMIGELAAVVSGDLAAD